MTEIRKRLFVKITHKYLPQVRTKYPFLYLERGRLAIDDSSVKWIDSEGHVIRLPIATINTLLLGPGTSITHEAVKVLAAANCAVCWVGEDSLLFYAVGQSPTADTRNFRKQMLVASDKKKSLKIARKMFAFRFPQAELDGKSLNELRGMEGRRVRQLYEKYAVQYKVGWKGRSFSPGRFELSDVTNQVLTAANSALYGIVLSVVYALGYSPRIGFIHSGSPLPFVYDIADLYKESLCIELAFSLTLSLAGRYDKGKVLSEFRKRVLDTGLLEKIPDNIKNILSEGE